MKVQKTALIKGLVFCISLKSIQFGCKEEEPPEPEKIPPTCQIDHPQEDSELNLGEIVKISAIVKDEDGEIEEVRYFIDDIGVGMRLNFPYKLCNFFSVKFSSHG